MKVVVQLFAGARELTGRERIEIEFASERASVANVGSLRAALLSEYPSLRQLLPHALFAINTDYATDETTVVEGAEIACIPPVSGG